MARELNEFCRHLVNANTCKYALFWWHIHEQRYPMVGMLAQQILGFQYAKLRWNKFSPLPESSLHSGGVICKLTTSTRSFCEQNWLVDLRVGCSKSSGLIGACKT